MTGLHDPATEWADAINYSCPKCGSQAFWQELSTMEKVRYPDQSPATAIHKTQDTGTPPIGKPQVLNAACERCNKQLVDNGKLLVDTSPSVEEIRADHHCLDEH